MVTMSYLQGQANLSLQKFFHKFTPYEFIDLCIWIIIHQHAAAAFFLSMLNEVKLFFPWILPEVAISLAKS